VVAGVGASPGSWKMDKSKNAVEIVLQKSLENAFNLLIQIDLNPMKPGVQLLFLLRITCG
jgi:23S rRNA U2552 (ribose-2'-O)-methylase RlmE/FtsJ